MHVSTKYIMMASRRKRAVSDNVKDIINSVSQADEVLTQLREKCAIAEELISNAEQEAITIVTEAAQRTKTMINIVKASNDEKQQQIEAMKKERDEWEEEKKRIGNTHSFEPMVKWSVNDIHSGSVRVR